MYAEGPGRRASSDTAHNHDGPTDWQPEDIGGVVLIVVLVLLAIVLQ